MAWFRTELRACRLCGHGVSSEATACPGCGHPARLAIDRRWRLGIAAALFVVAVIISAWPMLVLLWEEPAMRRVVWGHVRSGFRGTLAARARCQADCVPGPHGRDCLDRCFRDF